MQLRGVSILRGRIRHFDLMQLVKKADVFLAPPPRDSSIPRSTVATPASGDAAIQLGAGVTGGFLARHLDPKR
jgi:hypothetical protein